MNADQEIGFQFHFVDPVGKAADGFWPRESTEWIQGGAGTLTFGPNASPNFY
jgi:hypothetical protein